MEDEDLVEELENSEETQNVKTKLIDEDLDKTLEENKTFISHEEKRVCIKNSYFYACLLILKLRLNLKALSLQFFSTIH